MKYSALIGALFIVVCISSGSAAFRHNNHPDRCSLDGSRIDSLYEVLITSQNKQLQRFSCILSACIWLRENREPISSILVTDEATGEKIRAEDAFYVVSEVVTTPHAGNKIHVFAEKAKALSHASRFMGELVKNPFLTEKRKLVTLVKLKVDPRGGHVFFFPDFQNPLFLPDRIALTYKQKRTFIPQRCSTILFDGHFNPPYKPPRIAF